MLDPEVTAELKRLVEEKVRVAIVAAKPDDVIVIEIQYGLLSPQDCNYLGAFLEARGFYNVALVAVAPHRDNLKFTVIQRRLSGC